MPARLRPWTKRLQTWGFLTRAKGITRVRRWIKKSDAWGFFPFFRAIEFMAVLIAFVAFFNELSYRQEERTARAWQLVTIRATGSSGRIEALEYLNSERWFWPFTKERISLRGIDLTPPVLDEQWKNKSKQERDLSAACPQFVYLRGVNLTGADLIDAVLVCADLQEADLRQANLCQADLQGAWLYKADMRRADLRKTKLKSAYLHKANLRGVTGLECSQIKEASSWDSAYLDEEMECQKNPVPITLPPASTKPGREQPRRHKNRRTDARGDSPGNHEELDLCEQKS